VGFLPGVADVHAVSETYQLVSGSWKTQRTTIDLGDGVQIGGGHFALMAGTCSIENETQIQDTVAHLVQQGIRIMRGGVFKPRSSPYAFRGLGMEGLQLFYQHCRQAGIKIITEVMQPAQIDQMYAYTDIFQVGARNAQNFNLLGELGQQDKAVLIKRGISGTIEELLQSAEYVFSAGNERILLCERGIRTFETAYRNTFDINAIPLLKARTHLLVIADPSHGTGIRNLVMPVALAAAMAGADGLLYETHSQPELALSDGQQSLSHEESAELVARLRQILPFCCRS
jgi:3-deoxy-7-phosphoheptulonate synthase